MHPTHVPHPGPIDVSRISLLYVYLLQPDLLFPEIVRVDVDGCVVY